MCGVRNLVLLLLILVGRAHILHREDGPCEDTGVKTNFMLHLVVAHFEHPIVEEF